MNLPTRLALLVLTVAIAVSSADAGAQGGRRPLTTLSLDVVGPRTAASVRRALRTYDDQLSTCRSEGAALVSVALTIAADGSTTSATSGEDPALDRDATDCVLRLASSWRFPAGSASETTVAWSFRLRAQTAADGRTCWCFRWVHGRDHGTDCTETRRACERGRTQRGSSGDSTECETSTQPVCVRQGYLGGQHMVLP